MKITKKITAVLIGLALVAGGSLASANMQDSTLRSNAPIVSVTSRNAITNDGTLQKPYSVDEAIEMGASLSKNDGKNVQEYFKGIVYSKPNINTYFHNASFDLKSETSDKTVATFRVVGIDGADFTANTVDIGDIVVLKGRLCKHEGKIQIAHLDNTNAQIISIEKPVYELTSISLDVESTEIFVNQTTKVSVTYDSPFIDDDKKGVTFESSDPLSATISEDGTIKGLKPCDKVTITATSIYDLSITAQVDVAIKTITYAGTYTLSYKTSSNVSYKTEIKDYTTYLNGYNNSVFSISSSKLYANNGPHTHSLVIGYNDGAGNLSLTVNSSDYIIAGVKITGAKVSGNDTAHTLTETNGFKYTIDAKNNSEATDVYFYPFASTITLKTNKRVFIDTIQFEIINKTNNVDLVTAYSDAFINLTKDACLKENITKDVWNKCKQVYLNLAKSCPAAAELLKTTDTTNAAIERYKFCIEKYGTTVCEDYLAKGYTGQQVMVNLDSNQTITLTVIVSIAILAITSIALLVIVKHKKTIKE